MKLSNLLDLVSLESAVSINYCVTYVTNIQTNKQKNKQKEFKNYLIPLWPNFNKYLSFRMNDED